METCQLKLEIYSFINSSTVAHLFKFCVKEYLPVSDLALVIVRHVRKVIASK